MQANQRIMDLPEWRYGVSSGCVLEKEKILVNWEDDVLLCSRIVLSIVILCFFSVYKLASQFDNALSLSES